MRKLVIPLMLLVMFMFVPYDAMAQTPETVTGLMTLPEERIESFTFDKIQDGYTWELDNDGFLYQQWDADRLGTNPEPNPEYPQVTENYTIEKIGEDTFNYTTHDPYVLDDDDDWTPYILVEDNQVVQVQVNGGNFVFDKSQGVATIFDDEGVIIDSDSYTVKTALLNSDVWNILSVNDSPVTTTVVESGEYVTVSFIREDTEGLFKTEYIIGNGEVKTTVYFTNYTFENNKFAFNQNLNLPDSIIALNDQVIDLNNYVGQTFPREILEQNEDLILEIKELHYSSGLGFENLWSVNVVSPTNVSLDYANVEEVQTAIGETVELDPTWSYGPAGWGDRYFIYSVNGVAATTCDAPWTVYLGNAANYLTFPSSGTTNSNCYLPVNQFNISTLPSTAIITNVSMYHEVFNSSSPRNCDFVAMDASRTLATATGAAGIYNEITTGTVMLANDSACASGIGSYTADFGSAGVTELTNDIANGNTHFVVGIKPTVGIVRDANTHQQISQNQKLSVTYTSPPTTPTNLTATFNSPNVDLTWSASDNYSDYIVSSIAKNDYGTGIALPATWLTWQSGANPTTPTMGVGGVIGTAFDFNGSTDMIGANHVTGFPNSTVAPTQASISMWIKPEATGSSVGNPFGGTGFQSYWITNTPLWSQYPSNSFNMGSIYSNGGVYNMQQWNHLVLTIDSTTSSNTTTVYVNGSIVPMFNYPSGTGGGASNNSNSKTAGNLVANMQLGGQYHPSQFKYPFDGKMDEFSSWNKILSQSEVITLYNSGNGNTPDSISSNNNLITYFPLDNLSAPLPNMAVVTDPITVTYNVNRNGVTVGTPTSTTFTDSPTVGGTYDYMLSATTTYGTSGNSTTQSIDLSLPGAPTGLTATFNNPNVDLSWSASGAGGSPITGYKVETSTNGTTWTDIIADTGSTATTYSHTAPVMGSLNYYKVSAINSLGTGNDSTIVENTTDLIADYDINLTRDNNCTTGNLTSFPTAETVTVGIGSWANQCYRGFLEFDTSTIPDTATITDTDFKFEVKTILNNNNAMQSCVFVDTSTTRQTDTASTMWTAVGSGTNFLSDSTCTSVGTNKSVDLGSSADTLIQNKLSSDYFSFGLKSNDETTLGGDFTQLYSADSGTWPNSNPATPYPTLSLAYLTSATAPSVMAGAPPVAPTNLAATTSDPIILTWTASPDPDAASPVLHYSMERSTDGTTWSTLSANMGNVVTYTDNTTTAGTIYHYQVTAHTNAGAGPASTPTSASAGTVSSAPQTLAVTQTVPAQLDTTWAAPADDGSTGGITGYKVYRDGVVQATLGNVLAYNDTTIAAGTQYTYTVTALNAAGESTISNGIVITSWALPDAPTGATASGGIPIVVSWNAPNSDRPVTDYKVYRDGSLLTTVTAPTLTYSDSNVTPNTTYSYTISAVSSVGEGAQSASTSGQSGVPPSQITTFTATPVDSSRIKLDWAAPNDNGYTITSYKIYQGSSQVGTTAGLTYTDTGLQNNTSYSYTVTAVNIGGEGTPSAAQTATTATPLTPPTNVYTEEHVTSVNVTWDKVIGAVNYTVERNGTTLGTTANFWFIDNTASASTSYTYKVYANSSAVNGFVGTTNTVTTASATPHQYVTVTPTAPSANAYTIDMYELHRNGSMVGYLEPNNLTYEDHDVTIGTTYTYQVRAHNLLGWSQLSPVGSVTTWNVPSVITTLAGNVGSPIILTWTAPATDKPITLYTVYRDGSLLATTTNLTHSDNSVAAGSTYVYTATATSVVGEGIQSAGLSLQAGTVTTVPQNALATTQTGNNISFSWTAPSSNGGVPVTGYNPQASTDGGTTWTDLLTTPSAATSFSHTGLTTGQNYSYQVLAINSVGNSPYTSSVSTVAGDAPSQVTGLATTAVSDTEIDLAWNIPANNAYSISVYNVLRSVDGTTWTSFTTATNSYSDTGLTADTVYHYKVSAVNILGTGPESAVSQQRTFGLPDPVTSITLTPQSTTQIDLSWTQPNLNGFPLSAYTVQYSTNSGTTWTTLATQTSTTYTSTALTQNTVYDYRINTANSFGNTDGSINTATTYPIATNLISGTTQSDTEIQVTWNAIAGNGSVQYSLEKSDDSGVTWTPLSIYLTGTTHTDTGLTPLTGYNYRVASVNSAGLSSPSISSNTVTTFGPSDIPTNLALTALLNAEIKLDWVAPTTTNGAPVTSYNIERSINGSTWSVLVNNVSGLTHTDTSLTTSQVYYYKVSANNLYGTSGFSASANVMASDVPSQVTGLVATSLQNYEIQLDWTAPNANGYSVSGYTIERSTDAGSTWSVLAADTQNTDVTYTDISLTVSQTYHYKISAINQVGTGLASADANAQAGDIPNVPVLTLTALPNSVIQSDWTSPTDNGFAITTYQLERSDDAGVTWNAVTSINANTFQNTGLTNSVSYQYKVSATNQVGTSAFSGAVAMIAGDIPSQVTGLAATTTSNTSIDLAWTTPSSNGYAISGYMIESSIDNGVTWSTLVADTQSTSVTYSDTGLTTGTYYTYKISAINPLGTGQASTTSTSHAGDVPDATVLTATPSASGQITLSWTVPGDNGFTLDKYLVERSTDGITYTSIASIVPSTGVTTHTDTGVVGTLYYYNVTTENAIGFSPDSNIESLNAGDVPGIVTNLAGTTQSDTQINLTWTVALPNGYPVTGHVIEQSLDNITWNVIVADTQTTQTSHTVSGLTTQTDYYYRVSAINQIGTGALSNTVQLHTFGPPDAIGTVNATATSTSATLSWTAPFDHGSPITGYKVEVQDFVTGNWLNLATVTTNTYTQVNMIPNTQYEYRVTAINPYGTSYSPNTIVSTLATVSGTPTVTVISGTELKVEWAAVTGTGITYTIYTSPDDITYTAGPVGHPTAYFNHQGLTNGQTVYYKVSVLNSSGGSTQSPSAVGTTYTTPDAPTNIQITHSTPLSATITWTAPANDGGDPSNLSYTLQRSNDNANWTSYISTTSTATIDSGLSTGTQYYWRVNSVNSAGIGGTGGTVSYLAPDLPTAPTGLTAALTGTTNSASVLNWGAPSNTSGYSIIGYQIERNDNNTGWTVFVADTGNSGTVYTNTGLTAGTSYVYRVSALTAVGEGPASNTATVQPVLAVLSIVTQPTGGNSVLVTPTITVTGSSSATIVQQALYIDNARDVYKSVSIPLTNNAALQAMTSYPTQTSSFYATITLDTGYIIQSVSVPGTPASPFVTGNITFGEDRIEYTSSATCYAAGGLWQAPSNPLSGTALACTLSYTESVLDFTVQPVGANVIISYQPQNLNEPAIVKAFTATSTQITETTEVDPEVDYYGSIIVNPQFEYTINADQTITVVCDPNDIMCDDSDTDISTPGIQSDVPKGVPAEKTFKSFKSPDATRQLGIEPMGNLFGVNMVFIFVIALAGIFTGRSAPMGVIFIVVTLGIMSFLGYLDFGSDLMNATTWSLLIIAAILGIFLGKRWS